MDHDAGQRGRWFVLGQALGSAALVVAWWLFPARGWALPALILAAAGVLLAAAAGLALGRSFRVDPEPHDHAGLVETGVYHWVRHPMYIGALLAVAAAAVSRPSWPVIAIALANCAWYLLKASFEEGRLLARYPDYEHYRRRTLGLPSLHRAPPGRKP